MKFAQIEEIENGLIGLNTPPEIMDYWHRLKPYLVLQEIEKDLFEIIVPSGMEENYTRGLVQDIMKRFKLEYK